MKTDTNSKILAYIKQKQPVTAKEIVSFSGFSPQAVFRQLKKLQKNKQIYKVGRTPKVLYYAYADNMNVNSQLITSAQNWAISGDERLALPEQLCQTKDVFLARSDRLVKILKPVVQNENLSFLLAAVVGEIGNNSFDHNVGQWSDVPGIFFLVDIAERVIILADRGQGVLTTLKRVRPQLKTSAEALKVAFTEMVSGRAPEQRGNGLKFVKKVVMENNLRLVFYSGDAKAEINSDGLTITNSENIFPGTLSILNF